uniref:Odorant receptor n=1 Tax=Phlebotomus papatasi TaxID=29031 RepID=A0A3F2ZED8_PHLPP
MAGTKRCAINLDLSKKYLNLCFDWIYLEFLRKSKSLIQNILILSIYPLFLVICGFFMIIEISKFKIGGNFTFFAYLMVYFGATYQCLWKYFVFLLYDEKIKKMRKFIDDIQTSIQSTSILSDIRISEYQKALKFYIFFVKSGCVVIASTVIQINIYNVYVTNFTSILMFTIPLLPETSAFYRPVNLIFQFISLKILAIIFIGSDFLFAILVGCLDGELRSIVAYILTMKDEKVARTEGKEILKMVYENHLRVLLILNDLRTIFWNLSLQFLLTSFLYMCFTIFLARVLIISFSTIIICFNATAILFMYSYMSQIILNRTEGVAYALWQTSWYNLAIDDKRTFIMVLRMAQKQKGLSVCGVTTISINTFVQVLKAAITFGTLLYTFIN